MDHASSTTATGQRQGPLTPRRRKGAKGGAPSPLSTPVDVTPLSTSPELTAKASKAEPEESQTSSDTTEKKMEAEDNEKGTESGSKDSSTVVDSALAPAPRKPSLNSGSFPPQSTAAEKTNFDEHTFTYGELMGIIQYLTVYWQKMKAHLIKMDNNLGVSTCAWLSL